MTSADTTPTVSCPLRPDAEVVSQALSILHLFADRPTLRETARRTLQQVFDDQFPGFDIPVATAVVLEPRWSETPEGPSFAGYQSHGLTDLLLESYWNGRCRAFSDKSFLSRYASVETPPAIDIDLSEIREMLDEWGPQLLACYQYELATFWSQSNEDDGSPWQQLRDLFLKQLTIASEALVGDLFLTVKSVLDYPDSTQRETVQGDAATEAAVTFVYEDASTLAPDDVLVLSMLRKVEGRTIALLYTLSGGIEVFRSEEAMRQSWFGARRCLSLRNYWAEHDIFEALTLSLLERQLQVIAAIKPAAFVDLPSLERRLEQLGSPTMLFGAFRSDHETRLSTLEGFLPSWLKQAYPAERGAYSKLLALLAARNRTGTSFLSDIAPIHEYAEKVLKALMVEDDPTRKDINVGGIEVTLHRLVNTPIEILFPPFPEPHYQTTRSTFVQLAVKNIGALPQVLSQIHYLKGEPPLWLTYDYLRELTTLADIGQRYPDMLQRKLLDDPLERSQRRQQFRASMRIQLPLLALELKIRNRLSDLAYRQVVAALQPDTVDRQVEEHAMVVRPLGFQIGTDTRADYVLNMFVIGPQELGRGPHILYRPAWDKPMLEFASWAALLSAIQENGSLQRSVLAGLAPSVRDVYDNGGFVEPHVGRVVIGDYDALQSQSVSLASRPLAVDVFSELYRSCAQALIEQAKGDSVSNSEARLDQLKDSGWVLFNLLQPLLDGPLATISLLVQLTKSIEGFVKHEKAENRLEAAADVLMNLALILVHSGSPVPAIARTEASGVVGETALDQRIPLDNKIDRQPVGPFGGEPKLSYGWSSARGQLSARQLADLDSFKLSGPLRGESLVKSGEFRGLYKQGGYWYACVEDNWFRVSPALDGVVITDPRVASRRGPWLKSDEQGRWSFDFRLRLLGGAGLSVRAKRKLKKLEKDARELLAGYDGKVADARRMSKTTHSPADVESLIMDQADPYQAAADNIEQLTRPAGEESLKAVVDKLRDTATRLRKLAQQTRIEMYKSRNPTAGAVEYLLGKEEISIRKVGERIALATDKDTDFLQEYEIRDTANNTGLWYAHFHYRTKVAAPDSFTKAHLKTTAQRRLGLKFQKDQQAAGLSVTSIWRGEISPMMAKQVFFHL